MNKPSSIALTSAFALSLAAAGCSSADTSTGGNPQSDVDATYAAGPFTVEPGTELVMCTYFRGANETDEDITSFVTEQSAGGHHLIVYTIDHPVDLAPHLCSQGGQPSWTQILVTQIEKEEQTFPAGVGFRVKAHQQYVAETHYINTTDKPLTVNSSWGTKYGKNGEVTTRAATYFFGTMNIDLQPNSSLHKEVECAPPEPMSIHSMFGHEHRHGTGVTVDLMAASQPSKELYKTTVWDNPPTTHFETPIDVGMTDKVKVACDWNNQDAKGFRYPHEMCFAIGYFWPADAGVFCISGGQKDECACRYQGKLETGPGGSSVHVTLNRKDQIANAVGDLDKGAPIYCALFRAEDWSGIMPKSGAQPHYFRDQVDVPLKTSADKAEFQIDDVTPGDYVVTCMMDSIGGGFMPGTGDVVNVQAAPVTAVKGQTASTSVTLDFAIP